VPSSEHLKEADRVMTICNACRYCAGFCAVFPAMERRRTFDIKDLVYMSNLCFECRACYYACQYAPPHEFAVNVPQALSRLRADTYEDYAWPRVLKGFYKNNAFLVGLVTTVCIVLAFVLTLAFQGSTTLFSAHQGEGAFFAVVPYGAMVFPAMVMFFYAIFALLAGFVSFWRRTRGSISDLIDPAAFARAVKEAFGLQYMKGGGDGCNYPDEKFSKSRMWHHHLVFYGFALDFCATSIAAFYHNILHWHSPYPYLSLPVVFGTVGGVMMCIGTVGLLYLKSKSDLDPADEKMLTLDRTFLWMLFLTSFTGLLLLVFRETAMMGTLLVIHLGVVAGLFLTIPYSKFAHAVYRYAALVQNAIEVREDESKIVLG
jgi:citrate/tricarballylate utilization protein